MRFCFNIHCFCCLSPPLSLPLVTVLQHPLFSLSFTTPLVIPGHCVTASIVFAVFHHPLIIPGHCVTASIVFAVFGHPSHYPWSLCFSIHCFHCLWSPLTIDCVSASIVFAVFHHLSHYHCSLCYSVHRFHCLSPPFSLSLVTFLGLWQANNI